MSLTVLEKVGIVFIVVVAVQLVRRLLQLLYDHVIAPALHMNVDFTKFKGTWAVVTGATDGLGKAYAEAMARRGLDVVLISRTKAKLDTVAADIAAQYNVRTKVIEADFTGGDELYDAIDKELMGLDISVLVNNVGMSYPHPEYFLGLPDRSKVFQSILRCNVHSVTNMSLLVMPRMVERKKGVVINVSSATALFPSPLLTVYGATKAYVDKLSEDLQAEYGSQGVTVQCILPGVVATNMSKVRRATWMSPTPDQFVESALKRVGILEKTPGYYPHSLLVWAIQLMQSISPTLCLYVIKNTMLNVRERARRRYAS
ncbi:very-long-chain 3-oxoacyl-CoA reductase [Thrips palmi]|uniref:Very-long-chain 3-oxoacyl-CoA reductase n=1 Tax=Thrips palmi TaxID=161013 RepID=A0A6P8YAV0_THRPL|nr:very-long-chain 3-oxoacyl-CoA reductase [Thrips palmi]